MTDGRLREATSTEISTALGKLFRAFRPQHGTVEELSESYLIACHKVTKYALEETVIKLIQGKLPDLSKKWAPAPAELSAAVRSEMQFVEKQIKLNIERAQIEDHRPVAVAPVLFEERGRLARARMISEGRKLLFEVDSHAAYRSRLREMPLGSVYLAILGEIYGPPGSLHAPAERQAEPMVPTDEKHEFEDVEF